jgi:hypothetical protein
LSRDPAGIFGEQTRRIARNLSLPTPTTLANVITIGLLIGNGINAHRAIDDGIASFDECFPYQRWLVPLGACAIWPRLTNN